MRYFTIVYRTPGLKHPRRMFVIQEQKKLDALFDMLQSQWGNELEQPRKEKSKAKETMQ